MEKRTTQNRIGKMNETKYFQSQEFKDATRQRVIDDTWNKGLPMVYQNEKGEIVEHWKDGKVNVIKKAQPTWIAYKDVNFDDPRIMQIHVDTRDFHCLISGKDEDEEPKQFPEIINAEDGRYIYTAKEVSELIAKLYEGSGGDRKWRFLSFKTGTCGWELKYIRFYKTEKGFAVCTRENKFKSKEFWENEIDSENLPTEDNKGKCSIT